MGITWSNWSGSVTSTPAEMLHPASLDEIVAGVHLRRSSEEELGGVGEALSGEVLCLPEVDPSKPAGLLLRGPPEAGPCATSLTSHGESPGSRRVDKRIAAVEPGEPGGTIKGDLSLPG